jgi:hypothetical protein
MTFPALRLARAFAAIGMQVRLSDGYRYLWMGQII